MLVERPQTAAYSYVRPIKRQQFTKYREHSSRHTLFLFFLSSSMYICVFSHLLRTEYQNIHSTKWDHICKVGPYCECVCVCVLVMKPRLICQVI